MDRALRTLYGIMDHIRVSLMCIIYELFMIGNKDNNIKRVTIVNNHALIITTLLIHIRFLPIWKK